MMVSGVLFGWRETLNAPAWSISVEFFCYLFVFPVLVHLVNRCGVKRGTGLLFTILAASTTWWMANYQIPAFHIGDFEWQSRFLAKGILGFAAGFFLCSIFRKMPTFILRFPAIDLMMLGVLTIFLFTRQGRLPDQYLLYAFPVLILFSAYDSGIISEILKFRIFQWLGERSYSIYLWHILVMGWVVFLIRIGKEHSSYLFGHGIINLAIILAVVLGFSDLSYRYFEMPCRDWIRAFRFRREESGV
jgi:peptidoglycan/LPS O-acetylase OafA/YrhL